jgi:protein-disulfide isomerase
MPGRKSQIHSLRFFWPSLFAGFLVCALSVQVTAQEPTGAAPRADPIKTKVNQSAFSQTQKEITREEAQAILTELRAIRELLQKLATQDRVLLIPADHPNETANRDTVYLRVTNHWHSLGREEAPITLLEFSDYQCPFCRAFDAEIFPEIRKEFIDSGKMRFVSLDLPLPQHPQAWITAEAVRCAGDQGKYWELRGALLTDQSSASEDLIKSAASLLSLDVNRLQICMSSHVHKNEIEEDVADADALQINGTPTFVLGRTLQGTLEGTILRGVMPYPALRERIDETLRRSGRVDRP